MYMIKNDLQNKCRPYKIIIQLHIGLEITLFYKLGGHFKCIGLIKTLLSASGLHICVNIIRILVIERWFCLEVSFILNFYQPRGLNFGKPMALCRAADALNQTSLKQKGYEFESHKELIVY